MSNKDFVPTKESDFREWEEILMDYIKLTINFHSHLSKSKEADFF
jgi:hypothetical protein